MLTVYSQRLLFRVLHAMSLYLPDTGYVQGMAALAATLLCYYEEDKAFVMLVRLWMLRGLERLYESGFAGLMEALEDFEKNWLRNGDVAKKLVSSTLSSRCPVLRLLVRFCDEVAARLLGLSGPVKPLCQVPSLI